jgi:hypothetical protein
MRSIDAFDSARDVEGTMLDRKRVQYNQSLMKALRAKNSEAADHLSMYGSDKGWWNMIHYWQTTNVKPQDAADQFLTIYKQDYPS